MQHLRIWLMSIHYNVNYRKKIEIQVLLFYFAYSKGDWEFNRQEEGSFWNTYFSNI